MKKQKNQRRSAGRRRRQSPRLDFLPKNPRNSKKHVQNVHLLAPVIDAPTLATPNSSRRGDFSRRLFPSFNPPQKFLSILGNSGEFWDMGPLPSRNAHGAAVGDFQNSSKPRITHHRTKWRDGLATSPSRPSIPMVHRSARRRRASSAGIANPSNPMLAGSGTGIVYNANDKSIDPSAPSNCGL